MSVLDLPPSAKNAPCSQLSVMTAPCGDKMIESIFTWPSSATFGTVDKHAVGTTSEQLQQVGVQLPTSQLTTWHSPFAFAAERRAVARCCCEPCCGAVLLSAVLWRGAAERRAVARCCCASGCGAFAAERRAVARLLLRAGLPPLAIDISCRLPVLPATRQSEIPAFIRSTAGTTVRRPSPIPVLTGPDVE